VGLVDHSFCVAFDIYLLTAWI
jgi:hypothetical protein